MCPTRTTSDRGKGNIKDAYNAVGGSRGEAEMITRQASKKNNKLVIPATATVEMANARVDLSASSPALPGRSVHTVIIKFQPKLPLGVLNRTASRNGHLTHTSERLKTCCGHRGYCAKFYDVQPLLQPSWLPAVMRTVSAPKRPQSCRSILDITKRARGGVTTVTVT